MKYCKNVTAEEIKSIEEEWDVVIYVTVEVLTGKPLFNYERLLVCRKNENYFFGEIYPQKGAKYFSFDELRLTVMEAIADGGSSMPSFREGD